MLVGIRGIQDTGKTALAVATIMELIGHHGYSGGEVIANIKLKIPDTHSVTNELMREFIGRMVKDGIKHKVVLFDEADRLFPARFWQNREQSSALLGLWQDVKLFNWIIWTAHIGTSVDIMLRQTTQIGIIPQYILSKDLIQFAVFNAMFRRKFNQVCPRVSERVFPFYDRWEVVK